MRAPADWIRPVVVAAVVLGIGLAGFVDGIVFHQVFQWHHMLSAHPDHEPTTVGNLQANVLFDGLFHAVTWIATVVGLALLWRARSTRAVPPSAAATKALIGGLVTGWGLFNPVEGVINHHILDIHHVRDDLGGPLAWDLAFLAFGALLLAGGWLLIRSARHDDAHTH